MNLLSQDTQWIENAEMPVIDDINITTIPRGCLVIQTAIQRPIEHSNLPNAKTYIIDAEIFNLLDEESKAALVLHEVLYREARVAGKNDSAFTRDLVGLFVSSKIKEFDLEKLNELMSANGISCSEDSISMYHRGNECEFFDSVPYRLKRTVKMSSDDFESPLTSVSAVLQVSYDGKFSSRKMKEIEGKGEDRQVSWQNNFEGFMWLSFKGKASLIGNSKLQLVVSRGGLEATYPHEWARIRALDLDWKIDGVKLVKKVMKKDWIDLQVQADRKANALEVSSFWVKCIEGYLCEDGEDNLLVFVGPHPKIPNQNGWHLTRSVKIRDNKPYSVCVNDGPDSGTCTEYVIGK